MIGSFFLFKEGGGEINGRRKYGRRKFDGKIMSKIRNYSRG